MTEESKSQEESQLPTNPALDAEVGFLFLAERVCKDFSEGTSTANSALYRLKTALDSFLVNHEEAALASTPFLDLKPVLDELYEQYLERGQKLLIAKQREYVIGNIEPHLFPRVQDTGREFPEDNLSDEERQSLSIPDYLRFLQEFEYYLDPQVFEEWAGRRINHEKYKNCNVCPSTCKTEIIGGEQDPGQITREPEKV